jgi:hypothetical protein
MPLQGILVPLTQAVNILAVVALVSDLHLGAERADRGEADGLGGRGEATIAKSLPPGAPALSHKQLSRQAVIKRHSRLPAPYRGLFLLHLVPSPEKVPREADCGEQRSCRIKDDLEEMQRSMVRHSPPCTLSVPIDSRQSRFRPEWKAALSKQCLGRLETNPCICHIPLAGPLGSGEPRVEIPAKRFLARSFIFGDTRTARRVLRTTSKR